jgi:TRAP-type C4-dicarboxylate transport system permease small subunit
VTVGTDSGANKSLVEQNTPSGAGGFLALFLVRAAWVLNKLNTLAAVVSALAIGAAGCVLTWEASARYFFKIPSDWQDETSILLLVGASFLSAAWVQERRGHIGIQALATVLTPKADRMRRYLSDFVTLVFTTFFAWKSWTLLIDAINEGQSSNSALGEPLWIPYSCMAVGMTLLSLAVLVQVLSREALEKKDLSGSH